MKSKKKNFKEPKVNDPLLDLGFCTGPDNSAFLLDKQYSKVNRLRRRLNRKMSRVDRSSYVRESY